MAQLSLTAQETEVLGRALETYLSDLRSEIAGTDAFEMREALKEQEEVLTRILHGLGPSPVS